MGRHTRPGPEAAAAPPRTEVDPLSELPGWGLFATAVAVVTLWWTGGSWGAIAEVTALGVVATWVPWWTVRHANGVRRRLVARAKVTMTSRSVAVPAEAAEAVGAPRRVTP